MVGRAARSAPFRFCPAAAAGAGDHRDSELDRDGREQLKVSRLAMDVVGSGRDLSQTPAFTEARAQKVWFSPVYFRKESEPYMTLAMARAGRNAGVTVAEVNLKLIWDVITRLKIGKGGYAYIVDARTAS